MGLRSQILLIWICILSSADLYAAWGAQAQFSGFQGQLAIGPSYAFNPSHTAELSIGQYTINDDAYYQVNSGYIYTPWRVHLHRHNFWAPLHPGLTVMYSLDGSRYFYKSPDHYPTDNYYEPSVLRWGIQVGSTLRMNRRRFELTAYTVLLDSGLVALYNNDHEALEFFIASGMGVRFYF